MVRQRSRSPGSRPSLRQGPLPTVFCRASRQSNSSPSSNELPMLFLTRWFGVTGSDAERSLAREQSDIEEIIEKSLLMQANAAAKQRRPLGRGTHVKGVSARAQFEVLDVSVGRDPKLAERLAKGVFAKPGVYPAVGGVCNADPSKNSDFKAGGRPFSFSVRLTRGGS